MKKKLAVMAMIILFIGQPVYTKTIKEWTGHDWITLSPLAQQYILLGYLMAAQAVSDYYGPMDNIEYFLHLGETIDSVQKGVGIFYAHEKNRNVPIYVAITKVKEEI